MNQLQFRQGDIMSNHGAILWLEQTDQGKETKRPKTYKNMETKEMQTEIEILETRETPNILWL
jgi:hypothetical protein